MAEKPQRRVNCRVLEVASGGKHLVFEIAGTGEVVGEVRVVAATPGYLPVIGELFTRWARGAWSKPSEPSDVSAAIRRAINGGH
jgi:hypothetical protein